MVSIYKGRLKNELTPISGCFSFSDDLLGFFIRIGCVKALKDTASRQSRPMQRLRAGQSGMLFGKDAGQGNQYGKEERGGTQSRQRVQGGQHGDGNVHTGEAVAGLVELLNKL